MAYIVVVSNFFEVELSDLVCDLLLFAISRRPQNDPLRVDLRHDKVRETVILAAVTRIF